MSTITSGVGLISGINYQSLISALVAVDAEPETVVKTEITTATEEQQAFSGFSGDLSGLQTIGNSLALPETFQAATTTSSDPNTLSATAAEGAAIGNYQFQVAQLVTTQQTISQGFANATSTPIGAGSLTLELGGGEASSQTLLDQLNGGQGVQRGQFRVTDGSGATAVINISDAVSLDDVVNDINSAGGISVKASLGNQGLVLTDTSGGSGNLKVQDVGGGTTAESLGILGTASGGVLNGTSIDSIGTGTLLSTLNDGRGINPGALNAISLSTSLSTLNDGSGISTAGGSTSDFQVNLSNGKSFDVSLGSARDIGDVIADIDSAGGTRISASVATGGQGLQITDNTGGTGTFSIVALNGSKAAGNLGILGSGTDGVITGGGISTADFNVQLSDGSNFNVSLGTAQTVGDLLNDIDNASGGNAAASISSDGQSIQITDNTAGTGTFAVAAVNGSTAAQDLGLPSSGSGTIIHGSAVLAGLDSVLIKSLNGGQGIALGTITVTNHFGSSGTIDLSQAKSLSDVLKDLNSAGLDLSASLNSAGTGIQIQDNSTGTGGLVVSDGDSNATATALGIAGSFSGSLDVGSNLHNQYVSLATPLSQLNGGQGIQQGEFDVTNSKGEIFTLNLANGNYNTVGDVIKALNNFAGVSASINADGNGILLTDTAGGKNKLTVADLNGGSAAADLNIAGTASGTGSNNFIDGGYEKTITVSNTDTLTTLQQKINSLGFGVTAQIVNDGSATNPYRLSLTSVNGGSAGRVVIDGGTTNLNPTTLVKAQDAAVFYGGTDGTQPLLITSNTNQITNVIKGVTVNLLSASSSPVTLDVTADPSGVENNLSNFVTQFNALTSQIGTLTAFNTNTNQGGLLLGDPTTQQIQQVLFSALNASVKGNGQFNNLASIGITIGSDEQLSFNQTQFQQAFATNPEQVQNLFSETTTGLGNVISNAITGLNDPISGLVTEEQNTLTTRVTNYETYYTQLATQVAQKQSQLESQFANLESTLAQLQSQQQVLGAFSSAAASTASSTTNTAASTPAASGSTSSTG